VTIAPSGGFNSTVALSVSGLPSGATGSFAPNPATNSSTLTVNAAASVSKGSYIFTVTGTGGSPVKTHTASAVLKSK
jgi:hypothetical protein